MKAENLRDARMEKGVDLGVWLGRRQAFTLIAGRCSAADAECLKRIREEKQYRALGMGWEEFCKRRLGISRSTADLIIQHLNELGPAYFLLAQVAKVTPEEYRRIRGAVRGQALLHAGEEIPIEAENAGRLAAAIEELRRGATQSEVSAPRDGPAVSADDKLQAEIEREFERASRGAALAQRQFQRLVGRRLSGPPRNRLVSELGYVISRLKELEQASWSN